MEEEGCLLKMKNFLKLWIRAKLMQRTDADSVAGKLSKRISNLSSSTLKHKIRNLRKNGFLYEFKDTKGRDRFIVLTTPMIN